MNRRTVDTRLSSAPTHLIKREPGNEANAGPAEVCWSRKGAYQWQPICGYDLDGYDLDGYLWNYHWNEIEAGIVCRQLNFTDPSYQGSYTS